MTKLLSQKPRVIAPDAQFPYGQIKNDEAGMSNGTPVNRELYADIHQFFQRLLDLSGVVANGVEDDAVNGFQLYEAFEAILNAALSLKQDLSEKGAADGYAPLGPDSIVPAANLPAISTPPVDSVFGRIGAVIAATGDYTSGQIDFVPYLTIVATNAQSAIQQIKDELDTKITLTQNEKDALQGTSGTPADGNRFVTNDDTRIPSQDENDALVGTSGSPSTANPFVTDADTRIPTQGENDALQGTDGTPANGNRFVTNSDGRLLSNNDEKSKIENFFSNLVLLQSNIPYVTAAGGATERFDLGLNGVGLISLQETGGSFSINIPIGVPLNYPSPETSSINFTEVTVLLNGWTGTVSYAYSYDGRVIFRGRGIDANSSGTTTFFILPAGYRPAYDREYPVTIRAGSTLEPARLQINDLGGCSVSILDGSGALGDMQQFEITMSREA